nr:hormone-sensitive lipase [Quercus suber]
MCKYQPRQIWIERPRISHYKEPIKAWLYFDGNVQELTSHDKIVFDIPGGGFVAMDPRCHDDKLLGWAWKTGLPVVALDYRKAPEYPYPYALDECYDAYRSLMESGGRCVGLAGTRFPKVIVSGDSAGGNLATGMILRIIEEEPYSAAHFDRIGDPVRIPLPEAVISIYPALDMSINNWMTDEQMALIKAPERRKTNRNIIRRKRDDYSSLDPTTPYASSDEDSPRPSRKRNTDRQSFMTGNSPVVTASPTAIDIDGATMFPIPPLASSSVRTRSLSNGPKPLQTRLAMSSMISYFNDRILSPEMLRAMIILYIGPHNRPDFATDYYLSPLLAPEHLLASFPKTYFMTGERDPLVDDTVIFAGRLRQAQFQKFRQRQDLGLVPETAEFDEADFVQVVLIPGISHGFMQVVSVFEEGREYINQCSRWMREEFAAADERELLQNQTPTTASPVDTRTNSPVGLRSNSGSGYFSTAAHHKRRGTPAPSNAPVFSTPAAANGHDSDADDDHPLEISAAGKPSPSPSRHEHSVPSLPHHNHRIGTAARRKSSHSASGSGVGRGILRKPRAPPPRGLTISRRPSLTRLASHEDLMGRRMQGLTSKLLNGGSEIVPETP